MVCSKLIIMCTFLSSTALLVSYRGCDQILEDDSGCLSCFPTYHYSDSTLSCAPCSLGCHTCSSASTCVSCLPGFWLSESSTCVRCGWGCSACSASSLCVSCLPGFTPSLSVEGCVECPAGCESCSLSGSSASSALRCNSCIRHYSLTSDGSSCTNTEQVTYLLLFNSVWVWAVGLALVGTGTLAAAAEHGWRCGGHRGQQRHAQMRREEEQASTPLGSQLSESSEHISQLSWVEAPAQEEENGTEFEDSR